MQRTQPQHGATPPARKRAPIPVPKPRAPRSGAPPADAKAQAASDTKSREVRGLRGRREPPVAMVIGAMQAQNGARCR